MGKAGSGIGRASACKSPETYKRLRPGKHALTVRVSDKAGNVIQRTAKFKVKKR